MFFEKIFACALLWHKVAVFLYRKQKHRDMKNTDYNLNVLSFFLSPDASLQTLRDMIDDLGLEIEGVSSL